MWAARSDIEYALHAAGAANDADAPEFYYLVRLTMGHLVEGSVALGFYRDKFEGVQKLLRKLSPSGVKAQRKAANVVSQVGGQALTHSRDRTFHYPSPDPNHEPASSDAELSNVLKALGSQKPEFSVEKVRPHRIRLNTADQAMLMMALGKHDKKRLRQQATKTRDGAVAFVNLVDSLTKAYRDEYGLSI